MSVSSALIISLLIQGMHNVFTHGAQFTTIHHVPAFTTQDLFSGRRDDDLVNTLSTTGLLAIRVPVHSKRDGIHTGKSALSGLCQCRERIGEIRGGESTLLADGRTTRSTIATTTFGSDRPVSLFTQDINLICGQDLADDLEEARDYVSQASAGAFVPALDRLLQRSLQSKTVLSSIDGQSYTTVSSVVEDAQHLEHFHVYSKVKSLDGGFLENGNDSEIIDTALDWHTDAGLFLAFIPAVTCTDTNKPDQSFHIKIPSIDQNTGNVYNKEAQARFPDEKEGEIIVALMLGAGAQHWLHAPSVLKLRAATHAVRMKSGEERAWYGMMHLVPQAAIVEHTPEPRTFREMKKHISQFGNTKDQTNLSIGCGNSNTNANIKEHQDVIYRRRLATLGPADCNNSTNLFCWMNCRDIPKDDPKDDMEVFDRLEEGESVYCLDPAVLSNTRSLSAAVDACADSFTNNVGGNHQDSCANTWYRTEADVPTYLKGEIIDDPNAIDYDFSEKYCWGATSMHMQGFEWEATTCVVFLFKSWIITSQGLLVLACLGTIVIGAMVELIVRQRPIVIARVQNIKMKLAISAFFYGTQLTLAYFLMLVVMTYSGPLVICVVLGLVTGHVGGNWGSDFGKSKNVKNGATTAGGNSTPCCNVEGTSREESEDKSEEEEDSEIINCCAEEETTNSCGRKDCPEEKVV